jgi:hypothetical protein
MSKLLYKADKAAELKFDLSDIVPTSFEIVGQFYRDGSQKTAAGKLVKIEADDADVSNPNLRIWCNMAIAGMTDNFSQEVTRMNSCGFESVIDKDQAANGIIKLKAGAKISCLGGVIKYSM